MRLALGLLFVWPLLAWGQADGVVQAELRKLAWQAGPTEGRIGDQATIKVPEGYVFLDAQNTRHFLELVGNPPSDGHYLFAPQSLEWFSVFTFAASGHVKDDEKIDPDGLLKALKDSDEAANKQRKDLGLGALYTDGWEVPPHYDVQTKQLEWGTRLRTEAGAVLVNYTSRLLGRSGVMSATLVSSPSALAADTGQFKAALQQFAYAPGERYAEFKSGDKLAEYGLAALVLGGAAAVATKKGLWAVIGGFLAAFWKVLVGLFVAASAWLGSIFKRKKP